MRCGMSGVFAARRNATVHNETYGGHTNAVYRDSIDGNALDLDPKKEDKDEVITEQPMVNRFMSPDELAWQREGKTDVERAETIRSKKPKDENAEKNTNDPKDPKDEEKPKDPDEDESQYLFCANC